MDLVARAQGLILKPKEEWVKIKSEDTAPMALITGYAALLCAIPAIAQFIGYSLIGIRIPFLGSYRQPLGSGLLRAILYYAFTLASVYAFGRSSTPWPRISAPSRIPRRPCSCPSTA